MVREEIKSFFKLEGAREIYSDIVIFSPYERSKYKNICYL
jgi:hypothetical protein